MHIQKVKEVRSYTVHYGPTCKARNGRSAQLAYITIELGFFGAPDHISVRGYALRNDGERDIRVTTLVPIAVQEVPEGVWDSIKELGR